GRPTHRMLLACSPALVFTRGAESLRLPRCQPGRSGPRNPLRHGGRRPCAAETSGSARGDGGQPCRPQQAPPKTEYLLNRISRRRPPGVALADCTEKHRGAKGFMYGDPCDSVAVFGPGRLARHHRIARKPNLAPGAVAFSTAQSSADTTVDPSP